MTDICERLTDWWLCAEGSLSDDLHEAKAEIERVREQRNAAWRALDMRAESSLCTDCGYSLDDGSLHHELCAHAPVEEAARAFVAAEQAGKEKS